MDLGELKGKQRESLTQIDILLEKINSLNADLKETRRELKRKEVDVIKHST